jgi:hypothetical protein
MFIVSEKPGLGFSGKTLDVPTVIHKLLPKTIQGIVEHRPH